MVRARAYTASLDSDKAFLFGNKQDADGFPYVGSGDDDDPFIIGITSLGLIDSCQQFASASVFTLFHADATFKLCDIGYPVISFGFTDQARSYQLGVLFVVSRRTSNEYAECFRSFAQLVRKLRGRSLQIDAAMGDAEDAQYLALTSVPEFADATVLMCFFHVLYNVRKKIQHLLPGDRYMIMRSIMDMHYSSNQQDYEACQKRELERWREFSHLTSFTTYFESEWINGRFWRWQVYHTPQGYPTTNNPCEVFNAVIKAFVQRRRFHMRLLLQRLMDLIEALELKKPVTPSYVAVTTSELVTAATEMINSKQIIVTKTNLHRTVCVKELRIPASEEVITYSAETISDFAAAFGDSADMVPADPSRILYR
ncbi:unnamed protein product [Phytophthora fragariaefolia]|uniref:Unnamed protein product n=1 Tax=Phytophthora fragariaefolia TaxID=1490495 RepID=A0A9W7D530_9STRA|nr:unnamed protein product [Phytophthora fragariaefolia]